MPIQLVRWREKFEVSYFIMNIEPLVWKKLLILCSVLSHPVVSDSVTTWTEVYQAPLSMGILQARILQWVAMPSSRGASPPRELNPGLQHYRQIFFTIWSIRKVLILTRVFKLEISWEYEIILELQLFLSSTCF